MSRVYEACIRFLSPGEGGRTAAPPRGPLYFPTAVPTAAYPADLLVEGVMFSLRIELGDEQADGTQIGKVSALVDNSPGSEALYRGSELVLLEGDRKVGLLTVR